MKLKTLLMAAAVWMAGSFGTMAHASEGPLWLCSLGFQGKAKGVQVIVGKFDVRAKGQIKCVDPIGRTQNLPVKITMSSAPLAPRIAFGVFDVVGMSAEISLLNNEPHDMLGRYVVAQAQGAIIGGVGVVTGAHIGVPDLTLQVSMQFLKGFGLNIGLTTMNIELDEARL